MTDQEALSALREYLNEERVVSAGTQTYETHIKSVEHAAGALETMAKIRAYAADGDNWLEAGGKTHPLLDATRAELEELLEAKP